MDILLAKTFLEIAATKSFVAAAGRLNVTQTAVGARVRALEAQLGQRLFIRNKSGARLTPAGERFIAHAEALIQVWDRARRQVGLPAGRVDAVSVGAETGLWEPLLADWLGWMRQQAPAVQLRAEVDAAPRLLQAVQDGRLDLAVVHEPPPQGSNRVVELLVADRLVMATTARDGRMGEAGDYVQVDWGPSFRAGAEAALPQLAGAGTVIAHGPLALMHVLQVGGFGFFRLSTIRPHLAAGRLRLVAEAPAFSHSVHLVYPNRFEAERIDLLRRGFRAVVPAEAGRAGSVRTSRGGASAMRGH